MTGNINALLERKKKEKHFINENVSNEKLFPFLVCMFFFQMQIFLPYVIFRSSN